MENELREALLEAAMAYGKAMNLAISGVSRRIKNNPHFFGGVADPTKSFTARTFDEVMLWFADNWPEGTERPFGLMKWINATGYKREVAA